MAGSGGQRLLILVVCLTLAMLGMFYGFLYESTIFGLEKHANTTLYMVSVREVVANNSMVHSHELQRVHDDIVNVSIHRQVTDNFTVDVITSNADNPGGDVGTDIGDVGADVGDSGADVGDSGSCKPKKQIVFLKTHKTGSTSLASIFERYGYYHDLTFALPQNRHFYQPVTDLFNRNNMAQINSKHIAAFNSHKWSGYNMLTNHVRYNRPEMEAVVHGATYVTILRSPVKQFESTFGYFELAKYIGLQSVKNPIEYFMKKPKHYFDQHFTAWYWSRNAQLYDLGFDHKYDEDPYTMQYKIKQLDFEFDLVMITEYFDESLLILRKLLCWDWEDILYLPKGIRSSSHRFDLAPSLKEKIAAWNEADVKLYTHFNQTLWSKIQQYGPDFEKDLAFFRSKLKKLTDECIVVNKTNSRDKREEKPILKSSASEFCKRVFRDDVSYTDLIRTRMLSKGLIVKPATSKKPTQMPISRRPPHG